MYIQQLTPDLVTEIKKIIDESILDAKNDIERKVLDLISNQSNSKVSKTKIGFFLSEDDKKFMADNKYFLSEHGAYILNNIDKDNFFDIVKMYQSNKCVPTFVIKFACMCNKSNVIEYIIKRCPSINISANILYWGAVGGHIDIIKTVINDKEMVNYSISVQDALYVLCREGHIDAFNFTMNECGKFVSPSRILKCASTRGYIYFIKYLIGNEVYRKRIDNELLVETLNNASLHCHLDIVKYLVDIGVKIGIGELSAGCSGGSIDIVKYLTKMYLKENQNIPCEIITKELTDVNKCLFMVSSSNNDKLFNDQIVLDLTEVRSLLI